MKLDSRTNAIANLVNNCQYCHPLTGCIVSDLKGKKKKEIKDYINELSDAAYQRIVSYHESCPFRDRLAI